MVIRGFSANFTVELTNTSNTFSGPIEVRGSNGPAFLKMRSILDTATPTTIGLKSTGNDGGIFEYQSGATSSVEFNNRQFELVDNGQTYEFSEATGVLAVTAVPEPATVGLAVIGIAICGIEIACRRRR